MLRRVANLSSLAEIDVLSVAECEDVAGRVLGLHDQWKVRSPSGLFFTLGVNAYMDLASAADVETSYFQAAEETNAILTANFADVLRRLPEVLGRGVGLPSRLADDLAVPGFHVWVAMGIPQQPRASIHFDLQYERILSRPGYAGATGTMSFTLPIRMPAAGSSLRVWPDCRYPDDMPHLTAVRQEPPQVVDYHVGRAVVHTGHVLHQIGVTPSVQADDLRITLQGHGLVIGGELVLYW